MSQWFYMKDNQQQGPITQEQLAQLLAPSLGCELEAEQPA